MSELHNVLHVIVNHLSIAPHEKDAIHEKVTALEGPKPTDTGEEENPSA